MLVQLASSFNGGVAGGYDSIGCHSFLRLWCLCDIRLVNGMMVSIALLGCAFWRGAAVVEELEYGCNCGR